MYDIANPRFIYFKGALFLVTGTSSALLLMLDHPSLKTAILLAIAIWSFARAYYCAFYVLEHYVDGKYRFRGLVDFALYLRRGSADRESAGGP